MNTTIRQLTDEANEILQNIRDCPDLTYQQRNDLMELVYQDVNQKLTLARDMLYAWTGMKTSGEKPRAE